VNSTIPHDEALLPHWSELASAIESYDGDDLFFVIVMVELKQPVIDLLAPSLAFRCQTIYLRDNSYYPLQEPDTVLNFEIELLRCNPRLAVLCYSNVLVNQRASELLCRCIMEHPEISSITLPHCCDEEILEEDATFGYSMLRDLLSMNLTFLDLSGNNIETHGCPFLPDYIATNTSLESLGLASNRLNDDDLRRISVALMSNSRLRKLD